MYRNHTKQAESVDVNTPLLSEAPVSYSIIKGRILTKKMDTSHCLLTVSVSMIGTSTVLS